MPNVALLEKINFVINRYGLMKQKQASGSLHGTGRFQSALMFLTDYILFGMGISNYNHYYKDRKTKKILPVTPLDIQGLAKISKIFTSYLETCSLEQKDLSEKETIKLCQEFSNVSIGLSGSLIDEKNAEKILKIVQQCAKTVPDDNLTLQYKNILMKLKVPEFPSKAALNVTTLIFAITATSLFLSLLCTIPHIKPIADIISNLSAKDKISPVGKFFKQALDFSHQLGLKKLINADIGLFVGTLLSSAFRGAEKADYIESNNTSSLMLLYNYKEAIKAYNAEKLSI